MKKKLIRKIVTNQKLRLYNKMCQIKYFFKKKNISYYGITNEIGTNINRSTKYVPVCNIQGRFKRTLKVFQFNRHIIRTNSLKNQFSSLTSNVW